MSERVYKLLNGSELLVSKEVIGVRLKPESMPLTTDGDGVIDDVLELLDKTVYERDRLRKELEEAQVILRAVRGIAYQPIGVFGEDFGWEFHYNSLKNGLKKVVGQEGEGNQ